MASVSSANARECDELGCALSSYADALSGQPRKARNPCRYRNAARREAANSAPAALSDALCGTDLAQLFHSTPRVDEFISLVTDFVSKQKLLSAHVGTVARCFGDVLSAASRNAGWSPNDLITRLLLPALVQLRSHKTNVFGIVYSVMKCVWSPEDWPECDKERSKSLADFVASAFFHESELATAAWALGYLRVDEQFSFQEVFDLLSENVQALRIYLGPASSETRHRVVRRIVDSAMAANQSRAERRAGLNTAADFVSRFRLDRSAFPEVARHKTICWMCYIVHRAPLRIAEDYAHGDAELLTLCIDQLARKDDRLGDASGLYQRHKNLVDGWIRSSTLERILAAPAVSGPPVDAFAPFDANALSLQLSQDEVVWVATIAAAKDALAEISAAEIVGVDLEWSAPGDWMAPSLALMQVALPSRVFLVDLTVEELRPAVASMLRAMLGSESPLLVGFSFHNDLRELGRSPWAEACRHPQGIFDLQFVGPTGMREGLSKLVLRVLGQPLCKAEQRSYWHRRPLRSAQRHYAALDAFVMLQAAAVSESVSLDNPALLVLRLKAKMAAAACQTEDE